MSEEKERTLDDVNFEYTRVCNEAGDIQYKIVCFKEELKARHKKMRELNTEGLAIMKAKKEKEEAPKLEVVCDGSADSV